MGMIADLFVKLGLKSEDFNKGIEDAKGKTTLFTGAIADAGNKMAGVFGGSLDAIKAKLSTFSAGISSLIGSFKFAAQGGKAAADAIHNLGAANKAVADAQEAQKAAQIALTALQASGAVSAEAMALAEGEVAATSAATTAALGVQAAAQVGLTVATGAGAVAMQILKVAMISTGVGALVVAVGSLVAYFTSTREGAKMIKVLFAEMGAIVTVLKDRFSSLGEAIFKLFTLDFSGAGKAFSESIKGIGTEIANEAKQAGDLAKRQSENNKLERESIVLQQERRTKIAQLRAEAKEENKTSEDKLKLLDEAKKLIKEAGELDQRIARENADIAIAKRKMHKESADELKEDEEDKAKVLKLQEQEAQELKALSREYKAASAARRKEIEDELALQAEIKKTLSTPMSRKADAGYGKKLGTTMNSDGTFTDNSPNVRAYDHEASFGEITKGNAMGELSVPGLDMKGIERSKAAIRQYLEILKEAQAGMKENLDKINEIISSAIDRMTETMITGLVKMAMGMKPKDFGKELLEIVGQFMVTLGMAMITMSQIYIDFKASLATNTVGALLLGVSLVAAGTAISSIASAGPGGSASSASGIPAASSGYNNNGSSIQSSINGNVTFEVHGNTLKGVLNNQDRRNLSFG